MSDETPAQVEPPVKQKTGRKPGQVDTKPRKPRNVVIKPEHRGILAHMTQGKTISEAMIAMSYSKSAAHNPKSVTESKSWQMLMDEQLPEDLIATRHAELLNKRDVDIHTWGRGKNRRTEVVDRGPNVPAVSKALDMAYRLRGAFKADAPQKPQTAIYNLFYQPHIQARVRAFEDAIKDSIAHEIVATDTGGDTPPHQPAGDTGGHDSGASA